MKEILHLKCRYMRIQWGAELQRQLVDSADAELADNKGHCIFIGGKDRSFFFYFCAMSTFSRISICFQVFNKVENFI